MKKALISVCISISCLSAADVTKAENNPVPNGLPQFTPYDPAKHVPIDSTKLPWYQQSFEGVAMLRRNIAKTYSAKPKSRL